MNKKSDLGPSIGLAIVLTVSTSGLSAAMQFSDVTVASGITHTYSQPSDTVFGDLHYEWMTGGAVAEDFDGDGWVDLYILQGGVSANHLYLNQRDGTFLERATERGLDYQGVHMAVTAADYDSDGDIDIFISSAEPPHLLLINDGTGHFTLSSTNFSSPASFAVSPSWGDIDNDGLLDLALGAWTIGDENLSIRKNNGSGFTFSQELVKSWNYSSVFADLNGDRFQDLIAVSDFGQTSWYFNNQSGIFLPAGASDVDFGMGSAVGDIDNDGDLDLFITSILDLEDTEVVTPASGNRLLINDGNGGFSDITETAGVRDGFWGWGALFGDLDNDGDLDLFHVNGWQDTRGSGATTRYDNKPARLYENLGNNVFDEVAEASGVADRGQGRCAVSFDFDNDGDLDLFIVNHYERVDLGDGTYRLDPGVPKLLRNDTEGAGHWLKVNLSGLNSPHHSHGIGARVYVETGSLSQMRELNASTGYNGHGPNRIAHFGLAEASTVDRVRAVWTNGDQTWLENVASDQTLTLTSPSARVSAREVAPGGSLTATFPTEGMPGVEVVWSIGNQSLGNPATVTLATSGVHDLRVDVYEDASRAVRLRTEWLEVVVDGTVPDPRSIARIWNEETLDAIRIDFPNPAVHARNLFHLSIGMWDAWAAYDETAVGYIYHGKESAADVSQARHEAISFAAYRILSARYSASVSASTTQALLDLQMDTLGYDRSNQSPLGSDPAALGNRIAAAIQTWAENDGAREAELYADPDYIPLNPPLDLESSGTTLLNPNRWQPLQFVEAITQNGLVTSEVQIFQGSHWGEVRPFALRRKGEELYLDPGLPPLFGSVSEDDYIAGNVEVIQYSNWLDPDDGIIIDASPASRGLNSLGLNDGVGHGTLPNPATGLPYPANWLKRGDYGRVLAEFWADGPQSETPPGHWNTLANEVADHPEHERRLWGTGPEIEKLEWEVKVYLALNGALHDAAIAAWEAKWAYDYIRPVSSIRFLGQTGGLPELPGLIEAITVASSGVGERHNELVTAGASVGETAINVWGGQPQDAETEYTGRKWILAADWLPYQRDTFVTPAFAGYVSGHSTFSRAAAEVLTVLTGSEYFPGGLATHTALAGSLEFELGPSEDVTLQWARYYDAADEAGLSRLFGGIHVPVDDGPGRVMGSRAGLGAVALAQKYFDGSILTDLAEVSIARLDDGYELSWYGLPGFYFQIQSSTNMATWYDLGSQERMLGGENSVNLDDAVEPQFFRIQYSADPSGN